MKKVLLVLILFMVVIGLQGCKEQPVDDVVEAQLVSVDEFVVDEIRPYPYQDGETVYVYKYIIGYNDEVPIYNSVASKDVYELGDEFMVATIQLEHFDYHVIRFLDGTLDISWHKYLEKI